MTNRVLWLLAFHRFINTIAVGLSGADAVCMALMTIAALAWEGTENAKRADLAVVIIQLMVLVGEVLFYVLFVFCVLFRCMKHPTP